MQGELIPQIKVNADSFVIKFDFGKIKKGIIYMQELMIMMINFLVKTNYMCM